MAEDGPVDALCGWFDVTFAGSDAHPADSPVVLTTGPDARGSTHWGQQVFYCHPGLEVEVDDTLKCQVGGCG
jgi:protein arginine N-methyltransferase 1